ncbi:MAG TPA: DUF2723 domain-containing protein [Chitinophagaceae bacterium]|jgi:hypothetical protein
MNFNKINLITGWLVCLFACAVYIMTSEAGGSFWDCGEFVSSCFKVQIPHPPGAPLFVMLGRIFIVLFGDDPLTAAKAVNVMSALASGFSILFLFWTITHFARKIVHPDTSTEPNSAKLWSIMGAGIVGALAYTFTDSFWYSAVEGEVYAMSSFFTAIVFWAILKWENQADEPGADKWIVFIFFMIGLSIGVHLLCLLCIPAIAMAYYFRRRNSFHYARLRKYFIWTVVIGGALGFIMSLIGAQSQVNSDRGVPMDGTMAGLMILGTALAIGLLYIIERFNQDKKEYYGGLYIFLIFGFILLGIVQIGVIQYSIKGAGVFDVFFVNSLNLPFSSGFIFFFILVAIGIWYGLKFAAKKGWSYLRLALWCIAFTLIGYSTYVTTIIRSNADPSVDMYNVDNPESLVGYLGREQYGDFPILYGQTFNAAPADYKEGAMKYEKGKTKYTEIGKDLKYVFLPKDKMVFPRMWDNSNDQSHADYYAMFMGIGKNQQGEYERGPTFMDNVKFFISYQTYFMYIRYFLWNFSGKQNDIQGLFAGNVRDGNWISGIPIIDNALYGDQSMMPDSLKNNKAHNTMFMLPFILGLVGLLYHFKKRGDDALVNFLLFFFTGFAIVIYLNQPGYQPRERDYAYAGSFYAYAVWIGLAVPYFIEVASSWNKKLLQEILTGGGIIAFIFFLSIVIAGYGGGAGLTVGIGFFILLALVAAGIPYILKFLNNKQAITYAAFIIALLVPVWMGAQEWDDHDRSKKQLPRDMAKDYLNSCAPNAILFTFGDNDTYPLWYAQEVEGIRPDIRVINTSLLGIDWYINQLRYKVNKSDAIDVIWSAEQIEGRKRDYILYQPQPHIPENRYYDLYDLMKNWAGSDDPEKMIDRGNGDKYNTYPVHKVSIPVDSNLVRRNGTVNPDDSVVSEVRFDIPNRNVIMKNDLAMLNIIAANKWRRPIYFTMPYDQLGFGNYLRKDGLSYRLVPVENSNINTNWMYNLVMDPKKWGFGNANLPGVYFDEENRRHLNDIRRADTELAFDLIFKNKKDSAKNILERTDKMMLQENFAYGLTSRTNDHNKISMGFLEACYRANDQQLAAKVLASVKKDLQQQSRYYDALSGDKADNMEYEKRTNASLLQQLAQLEKVYTPVKPSLSEKGILGTDTTQKKDSAKK